MFEKLKARILFDKFLKRADINTAYAMVGPQDSWYDTITTVHSSLAEIQKRPHELWEITSHDHLKLKAVYYPGDQNKNITVLCIHGYRSHAEREWAFPALFYLSLGYNVLITYQRAHGPSEGRYITFGALERLDVMEWVKKINKISPADQILLHGFSMGGGIVLNTSDQEMKNVRGLIADAPSVSMEWILKNVTEGAFPQTAAKVLPYVKARFESLTKATITCCESAKVVENSKYPILLVAGGNENMEEVLYNVTKACPHAGKVVILPGCDHGNGMYKQTAMYQNAIREFVLANIHG